MSRESLKTLFHPFASEILPLPAEDERWLFLGAEAGFALPPGFDAALDCVQPLRPEYLRLAASGHEPMPQIGEGRYDGALILCGKHRGENENRITEALEHVGEQGWIVVAGGKEDGIQALRKRLGPLMPAIEALPKYHGWAVWFRRPEDIGAALAALKAPPVLVEGRFETAPGMFSHDRIDPGSELLASRLPTDFDGNAADFGAGWGYLSAMLAERSPKTSRIDLFEAEFNALEHAKRNLSTIVPRLEARFFWQDLVSEPVKEKYDLALLNPPFHDGHIADPGLGQALVRVAANSLRGGGRLMLVANRGLPYESILSEVLRESGELCRNARFKVLIGRK